MKKQPLILLSTELVTTLNQNFCYTTESQESWVATIFPVRLLSGHVLYVAVVSDLWTRTVTIFLGKSVC